MTLVQKLFSFHGRIRRRDWWLIGIAVAVVGTLVLAVLGPALQHSTQIVRAVVQDGFVLLLNWIGFALGAKRLHDRGRTAWLLVAPLILDLVMVGFAIAAYFTMMSAGHDQNALGAAMTNAGIGGAVLILLMLVVGIWLFIDLGLLDGTPGPNKYGPSPKADMATPVRVVQTA